MAQRDAGDGVMALDSIECRDAVDKSLQYFPSSMSSMLHSLIKYSQLYMIKAKELVDWPEVTKSQSKIEASYGVPESSSEGNESVESKMYARTDNSGG